MEHTILIVDDEPGMREVIRDDLEAEGYHVLTAYSGRNALEVYDQHSSKIELVLSDVRMADGDGLYLAQELKKRASHPSVVLISGFSDVGADVYESLGVVELLPKPYSIEKLLSTVNRFVKHNEPT